MASSEYDDEIIDYVPGMYLGTEEAVSEYLRLSLEEDSPEDFARSLKVAAQACEAHGLAEKAGLSGQELCQRLLKEQGPRLGEKMGAIQSPGLGAGFKSVAVGA